MKILVLMLVGLLLSMPVIAAETSSAEYTSPNGHADSLASWLNDQECIDHTHEVYNAEKRAEIGIGADVVKPINETVAVKLEVRYDLNNRERDDALKTYGVCQILL
jgi:hypothetical protein